VVGVGATVVSGRAGIAVCRPFGGKVEGVGGTARGETVAGRDGIGVGGRDCPAAIGAPVGVGGTAKGVGGAITGVPVAGV